MVLVLKTDNENSIAEVLALAKELNISVEQRSDTAKSEKEREELKKRILNFKGKATSSFGDALEWQIKEREDRELPFSR